MASPADKSAPMTEAIAQQYVGRTVKKLFPGFGYFSGKVTQALPPESDEEEWLFRVLYQDGDEEDMNLSELKPVLAQPGAGAKRKGESAAASAAAAAAPASGRKRARGKAAEASEPSDADAVKPERTRATGTAAKAEPGTKAIKPAPAAPVGASLSAAGARRSSATLTASTAAAAEAAAAGEAPPMSSPPCIIPGVERGELRLLTGTDLGVALRVTSGNSGEDRVADVRRSLEQWVEHVNKHREQHSESAGISSLNSSDFTTEVRRLLERTKYVSATDISLGPAHEPRAIICTGSLRVPGKPQRPEGKKEKGKKGAAAASGGGGGGGGGGGAAGAGAADEQSLVQVFFARHTQGHGRGVRRTYDRVVLSYRVGQGAVREFGFQAVGPSTSIRQMANASKQDLDAPDLDTDYHAWGDTAGLYEAVDTQLSEPELIILLLFVFDTSLWREHWVSTCLRHHLLGPEVPLCCPQARR